MTPSEIEELVLRGQKYRQKYVNAVIKQNQINFPNDERSFVRYEEPLDDVKLRNMIEECKDRNGKWWSIEKLIQAGNISEEEVSEEERNETWPKLSIKSMTRVYLGPNHDKLLRNGILTGIDRIGVKRSVAVLLDLSYLPDVSYKEVVVDPSKKDSKRKRAGFLSDNRRAMPMSKAKYFTDFSSDIVMSSIPFCNTNFGERGALKLYYSKPNSFSGSIARKTLQEFIMEEVDFPTAWNALMDHRSKVLPTQHPGATSTEVYR